MAKKFYDIRKKDGTLRRRIHDSKTGRIIGWEDAPYFEKEREKGVGQFRIVEFVVNYVPTKDDRPSSPRNWEFRIQAPEGITKKEIEEICVDIGTDLFNEAMMNTSIVNWRKVGEDVIEFSDEEYTKWRVIDNARPRYKYPTKTLWEDYEQ